MPHNTKHLPAQRGDIAMSYVMLGTILLVPIIICFRKNIVSDPDLWWHLKAGQWILEHGTWPVVDSFSRLGAGNLWTAYSWLPELALYGLQQLFGLRGAVVFTAAMGVCISAAFYGLMRRLQPNGLLPLFLTAAFNLGLLNILTPRPWLLTILFFILELDLLLTASRTNNRRLLLWLVPLFCLWANCHIQFLLGLTVLGCAVVESAIVRIVRLPVADAASRVISFPWMLMVLMLCIGATLITPYHYQLYAVGLQLIGQTQLFNVIQEILAMPFRTPANWVAMAAAITAAYALGTKQKVRLLLIPVYLMALYFSFRSRRDVWLILIVGFSIVAYMNPLVSRLRLPASRPWRWGMVAVFVGLLGLGPLFLSESKREARVEKEFPVRAVAFVQEHHYQGPLFNTYGWGGFLIYHLPEIPVNIDGRSMVHGQTRVLQHMNTLQGNTGWENDPELEQAQLVILPTNRPISSLLKLDPRFSLVYEDKTAVVFVKNSTKQSSISLANHSATRQP